MLESSEYRAMGKAGGLGSAVGEGLLDRVASMVGEISLALDVGDRERVARQAGRLATAAWNAGAAEAARAAESLSARANAGDAVGLKEDFRAMCTAIARAGH